MSTLYQHNSYHQSHNVIFDGLSHDLLMRADVPNFVFTEGVFSKDRKLAGQKFQVIAIHPDNIYAAKELNHNAYAHDQACGKDSLVKRTHHELLNMSRIKIKEVAGKRIATGGLLYGLSCNHYLLSMGAVVMLEDKKDVVKKGTGVVKSRGNSFTGCTIDKQIVFNGAATLPEFSGDRLIQEIFASRALGAHTMAKEFNRECVTTKSANIPTQDFYKNKVGLEQDGDGLILPNAQKPDNILITFGGNISCITTFLENKHFDLLQKGFSFDQLPQAYFAPALEVV